MKRLPAIAAADVAVAAEAAAAAWRAGALVAFPTETVYGLGADAANPAALARIFAAKGRPTDHPLIVHVAEAAAISAWAAEVPDVAWRLAEVFWPGPLTIVLPRRSGVSDLLTGAQPTIALRVPAHPVALAALRAFAGGVAAPSANRFGRVSPTTALHVIDDLGDLPILLLDGGPCGVGLESTILDLTAEPRILRPGGLEAAAIAAVLGVSVPVVGRAAAGDVRVSGSLARHYAPATPARLIDPGEGDLAPPGAAVLARRAPSAAFDGVWEILPDEPRAAGRALYRLLRALDACGAREILIERVPAESAWRAIADRLARATAPAGATREET
jgi:L-threonylcarbamoyladenylate synthase